MRKDTLDNNSKALQKEVRQLKEYVGKLEKIKREYFVQKKMWRKREVELEDVVLTRTRQLAYVSQLLNELKKNETVSGKRVLLGERLHRMKNLFVKLLVQK